MLTGASGGQVFQPTPPALPARKLELASCQVAWQSVGIIPSRADAGSVGHRAPGPGEGRTSRPSVCCRAPFRIRQIFRIATFLDVEESVAATTCADSIRRILARTRVFALCRPQAELARISDTRRDDLNPGEFSRTDWEIGYDLDMHALIAQFVAASLTAFSIWMAVRIVNGKKPTRPSCVRTVGIFCVLRTACIGAAESQYWRQMRAIGMVERLGGSVVARSNAPV